MRALPCCVYFCILICRGEIKVVQGKSGEGYESQARALDFFIEVAFATSEPIPEVGQRIDALFEGLRDELPEETLFSLFDYYERRGDYNKAQAAINRMLVLTGNDPDLVAEKRAFLERVASNQGEDAAEKPGDHPTIQAKPASAAKE